MAEEGNQDMSTTFSTLNVNAMEFVPSFCTNTPATATAAPSSDTPVDPPADEPVTVEPKSEDASPTKTDEEQPVSVAMLSESIDDKSPDNPGTSTNSKIICFEEKKPTKKTFLCKEVTCHCTRWQIVF